MEEELAVVKMLIAQERQILAGMKVKRAFLIKFVIFAFQARLEPVKGFFGVDENSNTAAAALNSVGPAKKSVKFGLQSASSSASCSSQSQSQSTAQFSQILIPLSLEEFEALPKYLRGRITIDRVNGLLEELNKVFCEKYTLLKANPAKLPFDQRQRFYDYKNQEIEETKGRFFVTDADLKGKSFRMDQTGRNILTLIRQAGRFKESRSSGIVRYIAN